MSSFKAIFLTASLVSLSFFVLGTTAPSAFAQAPDPKAQAKTHYQRGMTHYNLGRFEQAIAEFEHAYELDPSPILLFNIAQSHRQNGNHERAIFFYKRYLTVAPRAQNRADVEKRIHELEEILARQTEVRGKPPTEVEPYGRAGGGAPAGGDGHDRPEPAPNAGVTTPAPRVDPGTPSGATGPGPSAAVATSTNPAAAPSASERGIGAARVIGEAGIGLPSFSSENDLDNVPPVLGFRLGIAYGIGVGKGVLDVGATGLLLPVPYESVATRADQTSTIWGVMAGVGYRAPIAGALDLGADLAAGLLWWTGLGEGNPFTAANAESSAALLPSLRVGVSAQYWLTRAFSLSLGPSFLYAKTSGDALSDATTSLSRWDVSLAAAYVF